MNETLSYEQVGAVLADNTRQLALNHFDEVIENLKDLILKAPVEFVPMLEREMTRVEKLRPMKIGLKWPRKGRAVVQP